VLLPRPAAPPPLMIGSNGPRMLSIALPHAAWWNTWFADYGNTPEGFAALDARISEAARAAGRDPADVARSACAFVHLDRGASGERRNTRDAPAIEGTTEQIAARLRELGDAGADEVIVVASPVTERSIRALGDVVAAL
jgi:alkanesulfonate monooxygenase SsuD/methylene tetrahydromethanopterin reductase-like flavin-dependent oxidoreductase (luciferase family)